MSRRGEVSHRRRREQAAHSRNMQDKAQAIAQADQARKVPAEQAISDPGDQRREA